MALRDRLQHAWNAFSNGDSEALMSFDYGGYYTRPDRTGLRPGTERSIVNAVYNRIAIDVAAIKIRHVRLDENGRYLDEIDSHLNQCLRVNANKDQTGRALIQDAVMTLCDEGCIAIVPVDTTLNPKNTGSYDIDSLRVGKIVEWFPDQVRVNLYDDTTGQRKDILLPKSIVAIVENPLYSVMNEPNSTLRRLIHKLNILDAIDEQSGSGKLDMIIQLPYSIKSEARKLHAEERLKNMERQLNGSKYGIAYADSTERITQLNRPIENNLMNQITYLTSMLYGQLGMTEAVIDGTATEEVMLNYHNRTIEPLVSAIVDAMNWKFLTKTARTQGQAIAFFRDPFRLVPVGQLAEIADKFTRNEILTSNEFRAIVGYTPVDDARADALQNKNLNAQTDVPPTQPPADSEEDEYADEEYEFEEFE